ncbi:hypothetical protein [Salibacterium lacus]|uniref:Uncharacterized protein n=1 Tax=Salibacterium lacus TaxID=1898109 RepID=A0ABW5T280_9BACI
MMKKRKVLLTGVLTLGMAVTAACSSGDSGEDQSDQESNQESTSEEESSENDSSEQAENQEASAELSSNSDLTSQLESEESVQEAMVQQVDSEDGQQVNIDITIASGQELTEDLKSTYSDMIRQVYPDQSVSLIYAQEGGEMLEQTTLE